MTRTHLYLKVFVAMAVPFGLGMGLLGAVSLFVYSPVPHDPLTRTLGAIGGGLIGGLGAGVFFGAMMALVMVGLHFSNTDDPQVIHTRRLVLDESPETARSLCFEALSTVPKISVDNAKSNASRIIAKKGLTWRGWGDRILCEISSLGPNQQMVTILSRPWLRTTMVDYGSNLQNVDAIAGHLLGRGARLAVDA